MIRMTVMGGSDGFTCRKKVMMNMPMPPASARNGPPLRVPIKIIAMTIINSNQNMMFPPLRDEGMMVSVRDALVLAPRYQATHCNTIQDAAHGAAGILYCFVL